MTDRRLIWQLLLEVFNVVAAELVISRMDDAISLATSASLRGFHRKNLEASGR